MCRCQCVDTVRTRVFQLSGQKLYLCYSSLVWHLFIKLCHSPQKIKIQNVFHQMANNIVAASPCTRSPCVLHRYGVHVSLIYMSLYPSSCHLGLNKISPVPFALWWSGSVQSLVIHSLSLVISSILCLFSLFVPHVLS